MFGFFYSLGILCKFKNVEWTLISQRESEVVIEASTLIDHMQFGFRFKFWFFGCNAAKNVKNCEKSRENMRISPDVAISALFICKLLTSPKLTKIWFEQFHAIVTGLPLHFWKYKTYHSKIGVSSGVASYQCYLRNGCYSNTSHQRG